MNIAAVDCSFVLYIKLQNYLRVTIMKFKQRLLSAFLFVVVCIVIYLRISGTALKSPVVHHVPVYRQSLDEMLDKSFHSENHFFLKDGRLLSTGLRKARSIHQNITISPHRTTKGTVITGLTAQPRLKVSPVVLKRTNQKHGNPWGMWNKMVTHKFITSNSSTGALQLEEILQGLSSLAIVKVGVGYKGTQLKASMFLEGNQRIVFKPKRYNRDYIIEGKPYDGFDRHNGEIAAFHLDRLLGFYRAPPVSGRVVNLRTEVLPVCSEALNKTFFKQGKDVCFYGVCYYCKRAEAACADGDMMEGSVTLWLPPGWDLVTSRHPWQRTYVSSRKAKWEVDPNYCINTVMKTSPYDKGPRLPSIIDTAIFDFLIGNADRHHYETFKHLGRKGFVLHLDNGKSFGNSNVDEVSILAPLYQCCRILQSTWATLNGLSHSRPLSALLKQSLSTDPVAPVLTRNHLEALDRRLEKILKVIHRCFAQHKKDTVLVPG